MAITPVEAEQRHKNLILKELEVAEFNIDNKLIKHSSGALYRLYDCHSIDHNKLTDLIVREYQSKQWHVEVQTSSDGPVISISKDKPPVHVKPTESLPSKRRRLWWLFWRI